MTKRTDGWWFTFEGEEWGPYDRKADAEADLRGMNRTAAAMAKGKKEFAKFVTTDKEARGDNPAQVPAGPKGV